MRIFQWLFMACLPLAFVACANVAAPQTFKQQLAYGYAGVAAVRDTTVSLLNRKQITVEQAKAIQTQADGVRASLDSAASLAGAGDITKADEQLRLALSLLTALEAQLQAQGGAK